NEARIGSTAEGQQRTVSGGEERGARSAHHVALGLLPPPAIAPLNDVVVVPRVCAGTPAAAQRQKAVRPRQHAGRESLSGKRPGLEPPQLAIEGPRIGRSCGGARRDEVLASGEHDALARGVVAEDRVLAVTWQCWAVQRDEPGRGVE